MGAYYGMELLFVELQTETKTGLRNRECTIFGLKL